ncbi:MAG: ATP-grasp domain-containing protein [Spirochaetes bacterium]|jgi:biotin carboxylase|nr:ATP-grasp domain-containing protein [Spirochaetota bacterium]
MFFFRKRIKPLKLFVSIAAGENQIPLIKAAREMGYSVIAVDQNTSAPGFIYSDIKIQESITNTQEIYQKLRELLLDGKIGAILTRSYAEAVESTACLCEKLSIPYIKLDCVDNFINKKKMKKLFIDNDIPTPDYSVYNPRRKKGYTFPAIVKPVTGHAKCGVKLIESYEELKTFTLSFQKEHTQFLVEEYIKGDEIIAFGIVKKGAFYLYEITDKLTTPPPYFVDLMHSAPSRYSHLYNEISSIGQKIASAFSIECSPLVIECKIDNDNIYVLETVAEFGGEYIPETIIPYTTGHNFFKSAICAMTDDNFSPPSFKKNYNAAVVQFITAKRAKFDTFTPLDTEFSKINMFKLFKSSNDRVSSPKTNHDRVGVVAACGKNLEQAMERCREAIEQLNIQYK